MRLHWKIDVRVFEQAGYEIGLAMKRTESKLATPGKGSGRCRAEDGRTSAGDAAGRREEVGQGGWLRAADRWRRRTLPAAGNTSTNRFREPERSRAGRAGLREGGHARQNILLSGVEWRGQISGWARPVHLCSRKLRGQAGRDRTATARWPPPRIPHVAREGLSKSATERWRSDF